MQRRCSLLVTLSLVVGLAGLGKVGQAQTQANRPAQHLDYDVARQGPMVMVIPGEMGLPAGFQLTPEQWESVAATIDARGKRVVVGGLTVVAPKTMQVIETKPGKPDPYAGMRAEERLQALLSFFDAAQWKQAGSTQGIGLSEMSEVERGLFLSLLPETMSVQRTRLVAGNEPGSLNYVPQGDAQPVDPLATRLRLVRKVNFMFSKMGADDYNFGGSAEPGAGQEIVTLAASEPRGDKKADPETIVAYGVPVVYSVPSRLKPGELDFADPKLARPIPLDGDLKTLGDLLKRVTQATGLDLMADKRVAGLSLLIRSLPGQQARGSDLLRACCWTVTGAFRRVGASTYLLTDDVAGIGARFARLEEWAEAASEARRKAIEDGTEATIKHDPLSHLSFAPGDPQGLPTTMMNQIDDAYRKERFSYSPEFKFTDLPAAIQQSVTHQGEFWDKQGTPIRTDRIRVGMEMTVQFVVPGGAAVTAPFSQNIGSQYLQKVAAGPAPPTPARTGTRTTPPKPMPEALKKRVLLARLPPDVPGVTELLTTAKAKGFTEVWLHARLDDPQAAEHLAAAQVVGRKIGIAIGASASLLRGGGLAGTEDVNILGETGAAYAKRRSAAASPQMRNYYGRMADWMQLEPAQVVKLLTPLAQTPGLSALTLKASAAPGWTGDMPGGDGIPTNGHLGFDSATRLACLQTEGFDPIDVGPYPYALGTVVSLYFFPDQPSQGLWKALNNFRLRQNQQRLAKIHGALRQVAPELPLYLDDRASAYTDPDTRWFARWDDPARIAVNPVFFVDSVARDAAFAGSPEPILRCPPWNGKPEGLAKTLGDAAEKAANKWPGISLDLTTFTPTDALKQLGGLPDIPAKPH